MLRSSPTPHLPSLPVIIRLHTVCMPFVFLLYALYVPIIYRLYTAPNFSSYCYRLRLLNTGASSSAASAMGQVAHIVCYWL